MKNLDPRRARWIRLRMGLLSGVMALGLGVFVQGAFRVQVEDHAAWSDAAEAQRQRRLHVTPKRGAIYDRNGTALAASVEVPSVVADVVEMLRGVEGKPAEDALLHDASVRLAQALSLDAGELETKLASRRRFVWLKRRISGEEADAVRELGDAKKQASRAVRGLSIEGEGRRYYPGRSLAASTLGFVAPDGLGKEGLELAFDEALRGKSEDVKGLRDRSGRLLFSEGQTDESMLAGADLQLSLDEAIQHVAEQELEAAHKTYETKGGTVVVIDPESGELLALASAPNFNPNDYGQSEADARRNRAVVDRFEPGSTMKVFTMAGALAGGSVRATESIYCEKGSYRMGAVTIHDTHPAEWLSPTQILAKSSNIGALKIGLGLGEPGLYATFRRFGFGEPTGLGLPGESSGVLRPKSRPWFEVETANASFGQGIGVTAVQLAYAMGAIANGGKLMEPVLVRRVTDARGAVVEEHTPRVRREVVPPSVARTVAEMLTAVAEEGGTGVEAQVPGFRVAGKTATAQKVDPGTGKYSQEKYTASFVGFLPVEKPRLVVAVVLDEPLIGRYGGDLAGPVFRRVAEASLRYLGVTPSRAVARLKDVSREDDPADKLARAKAARAEERDVAANAAPTLPPVGPPAEGAVRVPDVSGLGAKDAARALAGAGLVPHLEGTGRLVRQLPAAGTSVAPGTSVRLVLEPSS